ncbi:MAG: PAS domain-containing protein, partial [Alphaproteobacteria bacterium]|nr:PAS domain-containing protein [Alphaproteobacteria bacterium]
WVTRTGNRPIIIWNNSVLRNEEGEIKLVIGIGVDVTERKAASDRLARAQRISGIGSWEWHIETDEEKWSDQFFVNLGLEPNSVKPSVEEFYKYVHPDDRDAVGRKILDAIETNQSYSADYRIIWPDGTERIAHEEAETILDRSGAVVAIAGTMQDVTALRKTEVQLQQLATRLEYAQRVARIGNWEWDAATNKQWWSDECYRLVGYQPGEVEANDESFFAVMHPDDRNRARTDISAAEKNGESYEFTCRINLPDGTERIIREVGYPAYDDDGKYAGQNGTLQDITEQYRAEQNLANTAHRLKEAERIANFGTWEWEPESDRLTLSDQTYRLIGLEPGSRILTNEDYLELVHPKDRQPVTDLMDRTIKSGGSYSTRYRLVRPDGGVRTISEIAEFFEVDGNGQRYLKGTIQDITRQHKAERELSETAQRLEAAMRLARLGNWSWDPESNQLTNSAETLRICGLGPEHAKVNNDFLMTMIPAEEHEHVLDVMNRAVSDGEAYTNEYHIIRPDGDIRSIFEHGQAFHDEATGRTKLIGTIQDITERKQSEQKLAQNLRRLDESQEAAAIGSWEWDLVAGTAWWSDQQYRNFGAAPGGMKLAIKSFIQHVHPADRDAVETGIEAIMTNGTTFDTEYRIIGVDGVERVLWGHGIAERDKTGKPIRMMGTTLDITERKNAELQLATTAENLKNAQRIANIGSWEWDIETNEERWSDQNYRIYGLEPNSIQPDGYTFLEYVHPEDRDWVLAAQDKAIADRKSLEVEYRITGADGIERQVLASAEVEEDSAGKPVRLAGAVQDITERKRIERALQESEARLRGLFDNAPVGIALADLRAVFIEANQQFADFLGYDIKELRGLTHKDFTHPDHMEISDQQVETLLAGDAAKTSLEKLYIRRDGATVWGNRTLSLIRDEEGRPKYLVVVVEDIDQRKQTEKELALATERLEDAQKIAHLGHWDWLPGSKLTVWSAEMYHIFGLDPDKDQPTHDTFFSMVHQDDRESIASMMAETLKTGVPYTTEFRIIRADGTMRHVFERGERYINEETDTPSIRGIMQDITERKAAELSLQQTMERLEEAQRVGSMGNWTWDPEADVEWWSNQQYRIFGFEPGAVILDGFGFLKFVHPDDRARVEKIERDAAKNHTSFSVEYRVIWPDGTERFVAEHGEWVDDDPSGTPYWRGVVQDITERKLIEQELARLNAELEQRVEERTAELHAAQGELVKNERLATLGQLTATVSHELRNPLGAMRTSMYVIEKKMDPAEQRLQAAIDRVNRNITRCDQIIDELLDYTRIRELELQRTAIDIWLNELLDEQNIPAGIEIERRLQTPNILVSIDKNRLRRAFINIFENACHAVADPYNKGEIPDRPVVEVMTRRANGRLEITVSDNGMGIPEDLREKIFEPLFSTKNFGVGLGLPTVKQIMKQHGGGVEVGEGLGGGAKFALWLPLGEKTGIADL